MPTNRPVKGHIPISPDLLQFVMWRENLPTHDTPVRLPGQGAICAYLSDLIAFGATIYSPLFAVEREPVDNMKLTARLRFECSPGLVDCSFWEYSDLIAHYFSVFLAQQWKEEVDRWAASATYFNPRMDRKDAIAEIMRISGMDQFREVETVIRADHRFRDYRNLVTHRRAK